MSTNPHYDNMSRATAALKLANITAILRRNGHEPAQQSGRQNYLAAQLVALSPGIPAAAFIAKVDATTDVAAGIVAVLALGAIPDLTVYLSDTGAPGIKTSVVMVQLKKTAMVITNVTALPMPRAMSTRRETPMNGQMPTK